MPELTPQEKHTLEQEVDKLDAATQKALLALVKAISEHSEGQGRGQHA